MKKLLVFPFLVLSFLVTSKISAETPQKVDQQLNGLSSESFALYLPKGGYIANSDGSNNFSAEQIKETGGKVVTYSELKSLLLNSSEEKNKEFSSGTFFRGTSFPNRPYGLAIGQSYTSQTFSGSGWRYSGYCFHPTPGNGLYLLWETFGDDALVGEQALASRHQGTPIYQGQPKYILSDINRGTYIWGVCYLSYNPTPGSYYRVSNL